MTTKGAIDVDVTVRNMGSLSGSEVVQLYTRQRVASRSRPVRNCGRFEKVTLKPGEARTVRFRLQHRNSISRRRGPLHRGNSAVHTVFAGVVRIRRSRRISDHARVMRGGRVRSSDSGP